MKRVGVLLASFLIAACGAVKERTVVTSPPAYEQARTASLNELIVLINENYAALDSVTVSEFRVELTGGSIERGYFEQYREAKGYLAAEAPKSILVNILNPLTNSSVLTMASTQGQFQIWIPSRNQFVEGSTDVSRSEDNPLYNVRPSHILPAILIEPVPPEGSGIKYFLEETQDEEFKYYVLVLLNEEPGSPVLRLYRKIWIERSQMKVVRQEYYDGSEPVSLISYNGEVPIESKRVHTGVEIVRPEDHYTMRLNLDPEGIRINRPIKPGAFVIARPPGAELIRPGTEME